MVIPGIIPGKWYLPLCRFEALAVFYLTAFAHPLLELKHAALSINGFSIYVHPQCLGLEPTLLLVGLICAYPASWKRRISGCIGSFVLLTAANIIRIATVFLLASIRPEFFDYIHLYLGQVFMLLIVVLIFIFWIRIVDKPVKSLRLIFIARFFAFASAGFLFWLLIQKPYVSATERILSFFSETITGIPSPFNAHHVYDYTFGFVTLFGLVFANHSLTLNNRLAWFGIGLCSIFLLQFLFRIIAMLNVLFHLSIIFQISVWIYNLAVFLAPVAIWYLSSNLSWYPANSTRTPVRKDSTQKCLLS